MDKRLKIDLWYYPLPKALSKEENDALIAEYLNAQSDDEKLRIRNEIVEGNLRFIAYFINNCNTQSIRRANDRSLPLPFL